MADGAMWWCAAAACLKQLPCFSCCSAPAGDSLSPLCLISRRPAGQTWHVQQLVHSSFFNIRDTMHFCNCLSSLVGPCWFRSMQSGPVAGSRPHVWLLRWLQVFD